MTDSLRGSSERRGDGCLAAVGRAAAFLLLGREKEKEEEKGGRKNYRKLPPLPALLASAQVTRASCTGT